MKNQKICAVTGRNSSGVVSNQGEVNANISQAIEDKVAQLIESGVTEFRCDAECGFPLQVAETIIALRDVRGRAGLSVPRLHVVTPYETQTSDWSEAARDRYYAVHEAADEVTLMQTRFSEDCYEKCERFMVEGSDVAFCEESAVVV
jgi:uncharacterized phage-like protein YoqJ